MDDSGSNASKMAAVEAMTRRRDLWVASALALVTLLLFYSSIRATQWHFDYTSRIGAALLQGDLGLRQPAPSWLNEMVPANGRYYSVFPLGAVLSMMPVAVLQKTRLIHDFPGRALAALIAALSAWFLFRLSVIGTQSLPKRVLLSLVLIFGTWTWCNLGFGGAWQIALGLALLGQIAALYFVLVEFRPLLAGAFFALALGNRTELALCLPIFICFLIRRVAPDDNDLKTLLQRSREKYFVFIYFLIFPVVLGFFTALYNYVRFDSIFDFSRRSRSVHRPLQLRPLPLDLRFWLLAYPQRFAGALVPARTFLASRYSLERAQNVVRRFSRCAQFSVPEFLSVRLFYFSGQSVSVFDFSRGRTPQSRRLDRYRFTNICALGSRQSRRLAVLLSLRHGAFAVDVSFVTRQRPGENFCDRAVTFCCFGNDQRARHLSISLDESNPPLSGRTKILQ